MDATRRAPAWMTWVLVAAGIYNLAWGTWIVLFPLAGFRAAGMEPPIYPELWQCIGMIVGVYGVGYLAAARDPVRHWPIVLVGFLGKFLGPIGFLNAAMSGRLPWIAGLVNLTNDLIWWIPFVAILHFAWRQHAADESAADGAPASDAVHPDALRLAQTSDGHTLDEISQQAPTLVVFLRHAGCTFCREALHSIALRRNYIESLGTRIVLVHLGTEEEAARFFPKYGVGDLPRISDPRQEVYRAFGLTRGTAKQIYGIKVWLRGFWAALVRRHGFGRRVGDESQMPGVFLVHQGRIQKSFRHRSVADRPDYVALARVEPRGALGVTGL